MKIPEPRKLASGTWFIQLRLGGKSYPVKAATKKECERQATLIKAEFLSGKRREEKEKPAVKTVGKAIDDYLAINSRTLSPSTQMGYAVIRRNRFKTMMDRPIDEPTPEEWQRAINEDAAYVGPKTMKNAWALVARVMAKNGVQVPDVELPQLIVPEHVYLRPDQILTFVQSIKGTSVEVAALLALHSLRRSEIFSVARNNSIDVDAGLIFVRGAVVPDKDGNLVYKEQNKSRASTRTVRIKIPELTEAIRAGKPIIEGSVHTIEKRINRICVANGLPEVGIHGLRHSFASLAHKLGWPEIYTVREGGWTDSTVVHEIYTHLDEEEGIARDKTMENFFRSNNANGNANENEETT